MPVVTPTRLPLVRSVLERIAAWRRDAALAGVVAAALSATAVLAAYGPLPTHVLRQCA